MAERDSDCLPSPLRGTPGWWQELGREADTAIVSNASTGSNASTSKKGRKSSTPIRAELVARIRKEIADGIYDTDAKWHAALDRLLERL
jgi:anti-sigma28 factor (negative regulator of flagellin synthesis)